MRVVYVCVSKYVSLCMYMCMCIICVCVLCVFNIVSCFTAGVPAVCPDGAMRACYQQAPSPHSPHTSSLYHHHIYTRIQ